MMSVVLSIVASVSRGHRLSRVGPGGKRTGHLTVRQRRAEIGAFGRKSSPGSSSGGRGIFSRPGAPGAVSMKPIGLAFLFTMFAHAAWAESCPTPAERHGRALSGHAKRVFIKECCERMAG